MKQLILLIIPIIDIIVAPFIFPSLFIMKLIRKAGVRRFPVCKQFFLTAGVFPIENHYFEPQFDYRQEKLDWKQTRNLPGIELNTDEQLTLLTEMTHAEAVAKFPKDAQPDQPYSFYYNNNSFKSGDAEYWYQIIRTKKPARIIEVGSGNSTLMAVNAIQDLKEEDPGYQCEHVCIEPYEMPWMEKAGIQTIRKKIEELDVDFFTILAPNDILFIDSSHVIRPNGDVLYEMLTILPSLKPGVIVHIHDIFTPRNYPSNWLEKDVRFWNEQYLLEAFLSHNSQWKIIGALNYLKNEHYDAFKQVAPLIDETREPGSIYIEKIA